MDEGEHEGIQRIASIDRTIHEPARLMIMAILYVVERADFLFLLQQTGLTQGNLSSHLSRLEEAGYIDIKKEFIEKRPHTMLKLTEDGRIAFEEYRRSMEELFTGIR
jgi:DNA-binding transcriptional ArsR family regulator